MRIFVYLLLFLITHVTIGQGKLILTAEENENWILQVEQASLADQLQLIRERLAADTNVFVRINAPDRLTIRDQSRNGRKKEATARPLIAFSGKCKFIVPNINDDSDYASILQLTSLITPNNIQTIQIMKGPGAAAIYGSRAAGGVFILHVKRKSICRKISSIEFGKW